MDEAIAAHKRAIELEPSSAELKAELAALYARQDRALDAVETAEVALKHDTDNAEANRILGSVYAALSEQRTPLRPGDDVSKYPSQAIASLEKAARDGSGDLGLNLLLGRLYVQTKAYDKAIPPLRRVITDQPAYRKQPGSSPRHWNTPISPRRRSKSCWVRWSTTRDFSEASCGSPSWRKSSVVGVTRRRLTSVRKSSTPAQRSISRRGVRRRSSTPARRPTPWIC